WKNVALSLSALAQKLSDHKQIRAVEKKPRIFRENQSSEMMVLVDLVDHSKVVVSFRESPCSSKWVAAGMGSPGRVGSGQPPTHTRTYQ
ncbi:MAG TPA: hypothetical protein VHX44_10650, partial [Planctomycetota bacterium]|nr:hypothetical protein [Planctomycetota bacterium]